MTKFTRWKSWVIYISFCTLRVFAHAGCIPIVPPTLRALPHNGQVTARKGSTVTLECKASGNPVPTIFWFKKDVFSGPTHLSDSSTLILENVDRHHAGTYQCSADNGVKDRVSMDIQLTILCKQHTPQLSH